MPITQYVASVEVATRLEPTETDAALADYRPVIGRSARGWVEVRLQITAANLTHACTTATAMARVATGAEALACQVMTEQEFNARHFAAKRLGGTPAEVPRQPTESERTATRVAGTTA